MLEMSSRDVYPAISKYTGEFAKRLNARRDAEGRVPASAKAELEVLSALEDKFYEKLSELKELNSEAQKMKNETYKLGCFYCDKVIPSMNELRAVADECEMHIPQTSWPYPSIGDMIFKKV